MDQLFTGLPDVIKAAAQSQLGILALLVVALAVLAYVFFAKASEKIRVGIFVLLFAGVIGFGDSGEVFAITKKGYEVASSESITTGSP